MTAGRSLSLHRPDLPCGLARQVPARDVAERDAWADASAAAAVDRAEDRGGGVARRVEPLDDRLGIAEDTRVLVDAEAAVGAEGAGPLLDGAEGRAGDRLAVHRVWPGEHVRLPGVAPVGVLALLGIGVVPLDGRLERVRVDAGLLRQLADRARHLEPVGCFLAVWAGQAHRDARLGPDDARVDDVLAEDDPAGGLVGEPRVALVEEAERVGEVVVGVTAVHEAVAVLVDDDRPRPEAHHHLRHRLAAPALVPRLVDDAVAEEGVHRAELGPDRHRHLVPVAGVRGRRHRLDLVPDERLDHLRVVVEAAAGEHDAPAGADSPQAVRALDDEADHRARVVGDQLDRGGGRAQLAAGLEHGLHQRGDQPAALGPPHLALARGQFLGPDLTPALLGEADLLGRDPRAGGDLPRELLAELDPGRVRLDRAGARE